MKKIFCLVFALIFCISSIVFAQEVAKDSFIKVAVGADSSFTLDKKVELEDSGLTFKSAAQNYDVKADIILGDILTITPRAGLSTFQAKSAIPSTDIEADSGLGFNLGLGAQLDVIKTKYADAALVGSYRFTRADIDTLTIGAIEIDNPIETIAYLHAWEVGVKVSKDLKEAGLLSVPVKPYVGVVYSDLVGSVEAGIPVPIIGSKSNLRAEDHVGLRAGVSIEPISNLVLSLDGKFLDETAIGAAITYKF